MQRTVTPFTRAEWERLVKLPGRVVVAATSAQADAADRTGRKGCFGATEDHAQQAWVTEN